MECPNCGEESVTLLIETFLCARCDEELNIEYNMCKSCGYAFKSMGGEPLKEIVTDLGITEMFDKDIDDFVTEVFGSSVSDSTLKIVEIDEDAEKDNMGDYIHRCIKCNELAFETEENGTYKCCDCGFEWEVIKGV